MRYVVKYYTYGGPFSGPHEDYFKTETEADMFIDMISDFEDDCDMGVVFLNKEAIE